MPYVKDAFHAYVVNGQRVAVNPAGIGTKAAVHYQYNLDAGHAITIDLRLPATLENRPLEKPFADFETHFLQRKHEADEFYDAILPASLSADAKLVARQAFAGLLWSKQY